MVDTASRCAIGVKQVVCHVFLAIQVSTLKEFAKGSHHAYPNEIIQDRD